jgi:hypothetical protein
MKTSCYAKYKGPGRIVISRGFPRDLGPGYKIFRALAPGEWFKLPEYKASQDKFRERYFREILAPLNARQIYDHLHTLVGKNIEPVLLCWEYDPSKPNEWCHRRMVADWFEKELGVSVPEWTPAKKETKQSKQASLFADAE